MRIQYNKLWKLMIDKNMKKADLREKAEISANSVAKLGKNEPVRLDILMKISIELPELLPNLKTHSEIVTYNPLAQFAVSNPRSQSNKHFHSRYVYI